MLSSLSSWLPGGNVSLHHAPRTVRLPIRKLRDGESGGEPHSLEESGDATEGSISLTELCRDVLPKKCRLNPFLCSGHLHTAFTSVYEEDVPVYYKRKDFRADEHNYTGTYAVDFVANPYDTKSVPEELKSYMIDEDEPDKGRRQLPERTSYFTDAELSSMQSDTDTTPMLIILHGLSGGSHEIYVRHILKPLCYEQGWAACVVNFRGCAKSKVSSPMLYNARATWDVRQTIRWVKEKFPQRPLFGMGFSLGANILINYLGEEGDSCPLSAAAVISNPWNLDSGSLALRRTYIGHLYSRVMTNGLKKLVLQNADQLGKNPRVNIDRIARTTYLHEFDRELQTPVWGYPTETAYYRDASCIDSIFAVRTPFLALHAEDDPVTQSESIPYSEIQSTPWGVLCTTPSGGHLGWFQVGGTRWFTEPVIKFFSRFSSQIDLDADIDVPVVEHHTKPSLEQALPNVAEPGTPISESITSGQTSATKFVSGPTLEFEPMRRKLGGHGPL